MLKRFLKLTSLGLMLTLSIFILVGCGGETSANKDTDTQTEEQDNTPKRIVSLTPSNTEILFALGLGDRVVGVTTNCDFPEKAKSIDKIGEWTINAEKVVALEPDLVVAFGTMNGEETVEALKKLNLNVVVVEPQSIDGIYESIAIIGEATGTKDKAAELIASMKADFEAVKTKVASIPEEQRKKIFVEVSYEPLYTAGKGSYVDELVTIAGGKNVADIEFYAEYSAEKVIEQNPEAILITSPIEDLNTVGKRPGWEKMDAVKNGKISDIDINILVRQSPRAAEGAKEIAKFLYPELF